jgi:hypothetical protein
MKGSVNEKKVQDWGLLMTGAPAETKDNAERENERGMEGGGNSCWARGGR